MKYDKYEYCSYYVISWRSNQPEGANTVWRVDWKHAKVLLRDFTGLEEEIDFEDWESKYKKNAYSPILRSKANTICQSWKKFGNNES